MNFIIDNFDKLFNSEESLKRLEEIILDLAVKGKLVPQDPKDEPASVLLEKIKAEKEQLIKDKKIKKDKELPLITEEEIPFEIPKSWQWVRLGEIGDWGSGATPSRGNSDFYNNGTIPWLKTGELNDSFINSAEEYITELALEKTSVRLNKPNDVLIAMYGATIGKLGILEIEATTNQACCACTPFNGINNLFLFTFLKSQRNNFRNQGVGGAQPNISKQKIIETCFPLPPLAEQKRIVEKVDKFKEFINQFREKIQKRDKVRQGLKASIMNEIEKSNSNHDLLENLELIFRNFDSVVKTKEDIKDIRDLVLSLAVKGKLVPQDLNDEPASVLLEKIQKEKEQLIKEKKLKKDKELSPISEEEIPFEIPESWQWVRLGDISSKITDGEHITPKRTEKGYYLLSARNVNNGRIELDNVDYVGEDEFERIRKRCDPQQGDLLISCSGSVGRTAIVDKDNHYVMVRSVALVKPLHLGINVQYLMYSLQSMTSQQQMKKKSKATAQANLFLGSIKTIIYPLPPLAEQKRIVLQVEKLMKVCDELEKLVEKSQKEESLLMGSIMSGLVG